MIFFLVQLVYIRENNLMKKDFNLKNGKNLSNKIIEINKKIKSFYICESSKHLAYGLAFLSSILYNACNIEFLLIHIVS